MPSEGENEEGGTASTMPDPTPNSKLDSDKRTGHQFLTTQRSELESVH